MLIWRPRLPKKVATKSPGFNIIEEYTLDEANAPVGTKKGDTKPVEKLNYAGNVETNAAFRTDIPDLGNCDGRILCSTRRKGCTNKGRI